MTEDSFNLSRAEYLELLYPEVTLVQMKISLPLRVSPLEKRLRQQNLVWTTIS